jgi:hypothetical protein
MSNGAATGELIPMYPVRINPYCAHMGNTLAARVAEIQRTEAQNQIQYGEHWASVRNELELMRASLVDVLVLYNAATEAPCDNSLEQIERKLKAINSSGALLRDILREVERFSNSAVELEDRLAGKHDPAVTYRLMQEFTAIVGKKLREYELTGELGPEGNSERVIQDLTGAIRNNLRMPFAGIDNNGVPLNSYPHNGTFVSAEEEIVANPAMAAQLMDSTVPHESQALEQQIVQSA